MKIAISGSGGTGKSTLAQMISEHLGIPRIDEGVRDYMQEKAITHLREITPEDTMEMQWWLLKKKRQKENALDSFIADRCTADNVAYALRWCGRQAGLEECMESYISEARDHAGKYDLILYLPWGKFPIKDDGVRSSHRFYQYEIDRLIWGILSDWNVPVYEISTINLRARLKEALSVIKQNSKVWA